MHQIDQSDLRFNYSLDGLLQNGSKCIKKEYLDKHRIPKHNSGAQPPDCNDNERLSERPIPQKAIDQKSCM